MDKLLSRTLVAIGAISSVTFSCNGGATALYFDKVFVKTSSESTCFRFAAAAARLENLRNVHKNALEVAGDKDGAYVSITCVGRNNQPAVAVVMSVSDTLPVAKRAA